MLRTSRSGSLSTTCCAGATASTTPSSATASASEGLERLAQFAEESVHVAIVIAPLKLEGVDGVAFFDAARQMHSSARRIAVIEVGDVGSAGDLSQAMTLSQVDMYFGQPWASPEEELHPVVGEALRVWARDHQPRFEKASIVDAAGAARGARLQTWLERNTVATALHAADSVDGRAVLERHGLTDDDLPVVALYDGRVLVDPADDALRGGARRADASRPARVTTSSSSGEDRRVSRPRSMRGRTGYAQS